MRVQVDPGDPNEDAHLLEPEYNSDTDSQTGDGVLSYRIYGRDLETYLTELGLDTRYSRDDMPAAREWIRSTELYYCRKQCP